MSSKESYTGDIITKGKLLGTLQRLFFARSLTLDSVNALLNNKNVHISKADSLGEQLDIFRSTCDNSDLEFLLSEYEAFLKYTILKFIFEHIALLDKDKKDIYDGLYSDKFYKLYFWVYYQSDFTDLYLMYTFEKNNLASNINSYLGELANAINSNSKVSIYFLSYK